MREATAAINIPARYGARFLWCTLNTSKPTVKQLRHDTVHFSWFSWIMDSHIDSSIYVIKEVWFSWWASANYSPVRTAETDATKRRFDYRFQLILRCENQQPTTNHVADLEDDVTNYGK